MTSRRTQKSLAIWYDPNTDDGSGPNELLQHFSNIIDGYTPFDAEFVEPDRGLAGEGDDQIIYDALTQFIDNGAYENAPDYVNKQVKHLRGKFKRAIQA